MVMFDIQNEYARLETIDKKSAKQTTSQTENDICWNLRDAKCESITEKTFANFKKCRRFALEPLEGLRFALEQLQNFPAAAPFFS
jgi:hypothetical protein